MWKLQICFLKYCVPGPFLEGDKAKVVANGAGLSRTPEGEEDEE